MLFEGKDRRELEKLKKSWLLPPGQSLTLKWPVLHYGSVPSFDPARWDLRVYGLVEAPLTLNWKEFNSLPRIQRMSDFHCVTRWSRFDNRWDGVAFRELLARVRPRPEAAYVLVHAEQGFTANLSMADLDREEVLLATHHDGEPLTADHGFPLRLIVPHLYAWKSVKWVRGFEFLDHDQPGFWEQNGYHMYGDPWKKQRFSSD
ncbi:MAG TPA: sulfite oxidase-like oxidoreductase [Terriglobales bacterium]|jgi:DMSO/TMAO reductase YedYZ molybdopterin-dependent catalytic subunit|nr:sulfite oxidase-like oxidoreductase [Terriglobales bacterium]